MRDNKYLAWTSFIFFLLSTGITLLFLIFATVGSDFIENPGIIIPIVGVFSLLATITGFLAFKLPQAKAGGVGGLILLLLVLFVTPIGRETTFIPPQAGASLQERADGTGIPDVDVVIDTVLVGTPQEQLQLLQFSSLACTRADGLGGPPKCADGEAEGTIIEAFPFLGPEGHHVRRDDMEDWAGIQATGVYAVYRVSDQVYSDEAYPAGEYAIVFLVENEVFTVTTHVRDGKIVRLDTNFGSPTEIDLERFSSEIILLTQQ